MEQLQALLQLLGQYPLWAKASIAAGLGLATASLLLGYPTQAGKDKKNPDASTELDTKTLSELLNQPEVTLAEVNMTVREMGELFAQHVQAVGPKNEQLAFALDLRCGGYKFDTVVYSYNSEPNQNGHWLFLFSFYEVEEISIEGMDADWKRVQELGFRDLEKQLASTTGFKAPLSIMSYDILGGPEQRVPSAIYVQVTGRRNKASQVELGAIRARMENAKHKGGIYRVVITYDKLLAGPIP